MTGDQRLQWPATQLKANPAEGESVSHPYRWPYTLPDAEYQCTASDAPIKVAAEQILANVWERKVSLDHMEG